MNPEQIKATEDALKDWWLEQAANEVQLVAPKAVEYGSRDLIEMGRTLLRVAGREVTDEEAAEAGVWFYVVGKIARWTAAMERGDRVSDDTLLDIGTYVKMAQRLRAVGSWPGNEKPQEWGAGGVLRQRFSETGNPYSALGNDCDEPDHTPGNACPPEDHQGERITLVTYKPEVHEWAPMGEDPR